MSRPHLEIPLPMLSIPLRLPWSFIYRPLEPASIRLLKLHSTCLVGPPHGPKDLAITCSLQHCTLADIKQGRITYRAISYVWGSARFCRTIVCDGFKKSVTANLYDLLWQLVFDKDFDAFIWVDAVCINQDDNAEKGQQVSMMCDIFKQAELVIVWLGAVIGAELDQYWERIIRDDGSATAEAQAQGNELLSQFQWFRRCWTYQEIILATRAEVRCGSWCVDWDIFGKWCRNVQVVPIMIMQKTREFLSLSSLLKETTSRVATNPLDKVYAIMGLWKYRAEIVVDYNQNILQVSAAVVAAIARHENWLWLNLKGLRELLPAFQYATPVSDILYIYKDGIRHNETLTPVTWIVDLNQGLEPGPRGDCSWIHHSFTTNATIDGCTLIARGALMGLWVRPSRSADAKSQVCEYPSCPGRFEAFPRCVGSKHLSITIAGELVSDDWSTFTDYHPVWLDTLSVYNKLLAHISRKCSCEDAHKGLKTVQKFMSKFTSRTVEGEEPDTPKKDSADVTNFGWLCLLFGTQQSVVLVPRLNQNCGRLHFEMHHRLPLDWPILGWGRHIRTLTVEPPARDVQSRWSSGGGEFLTHVEPHHSVASRHARLSFLPTNFEIVGDVEEWQRSGRACMMKSHGSKPAG